MTAGGLIAGFVVALLAGLVARTTELKEDAALATFYLLSLAVGVTIVSLKGTNIDLLHVLFGNVLALDDQTLLLIAGNRHASRLLVLALIYRPLVIECVDPGFMRSVSRAGGAGASRLPGAGRASIWSSGFQALGTLLAVGIMMLPAAIGRFWARDITQMIVIAVGERRSSPAMPGCCCRSIRGSRPALRSSSLRARSTSPRSCSAGSAGFSASSFPAAIWKRDHAEKRASVFERSVRSPPPCGEGSGVG